MQAICVISDRGSSAGGGPSTNDADPLEFAYFVACFDDRHGSERISTTLLQYSQRPLNVSIAFAIRIAIAVSNGLHTTHKYSIYATHPPMPITCLCAWALINDTRAGPQPPPSPQRLCSHFHPRIITKCGVYFKCCVASVCLFVLGARVTARLTSSASSASPSSSTSLSSSMFLSLSLSSNYGFG